MSQKSPQEKSAARARRRAWRWTNKPFRGAIIAFTFVMSAVIGVFVGPGTAGAAESVTVVAQGCTDTEIRNNMTCRGTTDPRITKVVLSTAAGAALGAAGGPAGVVAGAAAGVVNGVIDYVTDDD
jgi:hypothetical protein